MCRQPNLLKVKLGMTLLRQWIMLCGLLALSLSGCSSSDNNTDLHTYLEQLKKHSVAKVHLLDRFVLRQTYELKDTPPKSPFPKNGNVIDSAALLAKPPLQRYSLNALRLLGIIQDNGQISAVILTPDGKIYPLVQGDLIGNQQGKVIEMNAHNVVISETAEHNTSHRVVLYLKQ